MAPEAAEAVQFGPFVFDGRSGRLEKHGYRIRLQPKSAAALACLIDNRGSVVTREQLQAKLWPDGTYVDFELGIKVAIKKLRDALGDSSDEPTYIETVRGEGYRFIAAAEVLREAPGNGPAESMPAASARFKLLWVGLGAIVFLTVSATLFYLLQAPAINFQSRDWVLIGNFENRTGEKLLDGAMESALERELSNSRFVNVVPRERIQDALLLMRKPMDTKLDGATAREVCLRDGGIRAVLAGRIEKLGTTYVLSVQIIDPVRGETVASMAEEDPADALLARAVRRLSGRVRERLGESTQVIEASNQQLEKVTTPSLEALQLYTQAVHAWGAEFGGNRVAVQLLEQALKKDPGFASAHLLLAQLFVSLDEYDQARPHFQRAFELADSTSERERYSIVGSYYNSRSVNQPQKALEAFEALLRLYPDDVGALGNVAMISSRLQADAQSEERHREITLRRADLRPNDCNLNLNAAWTFIWKPQDKVPASDQHYRPYLDSSDLKQFWPRFNRAIASCAVPRDGKTAMQGAIIRTEPLLLLAHWLQGEIVQARADLEQAEHSKPPLPAVSVGLLYLTFGELREDEERLASAPADLRYYSAMVKYYRGDLPAVRKILRGTREVKPHWAADIVAIAMIHSGLWREAESLRRQLAEDLKAPTSFSGPAQSLNIVDGEFALAKGDTARGIALLKDAVSKASTSAASTLMAAEDLAEAYRKHGDRDAAVRVLEQAAVREVTLNHSAAWQMRIQLQLANLYREMGRTRDAENLEAHLSQLLIFADPDHPIVRQLAALRQSPAVVAAK